MPLLIPNRPPNPFFNQQRRRTLPVITNQENEQPMPDDDSLRLFPLESPIGKTGRKATPVGPLHHQPRPKPPQMTGHGNPGFSMAPPVMPRPGAAQATGPAPASPQQSSPEQAAQQFRRVNQTLPDGVRYEPLDDDTMRLLRDNGHLPAEPAPAPAPVITPPPAIPPVAAPPHIVEEPPKTHTKDDGLVKTIEGLIQDERNAHVFYSSLAASVTIVSISSALTDIARDCQHHTQQLTQLLANHYGSSFVPEEAAINTGMELQRALTLALVEENKSLRVLTELSVNNTESEKVIQRIINKKIVNYNQLIRLTTID
ncbi:MAG: hypothetical protein FWE42_03450 [Defluviitaleaceae bacterium]|nr:hypothetical protein [Defluviitaleaceae bacterium]